MTKGVSPKAANLAVDSVPEQSARLEWWLANEREKALNELILDFLKQLKLQ